MPSSAAKRFKPTDISRSAPLIYTRALNTDTSESTTQLNLNNNNTRTEPNSEGAEWRAYLPALSTSVAFDEEVFSKVMLDMVSNPNYNSSLVLRADVIWDSTAPSQTTTYPREDTTPRYVPVKGYRLTRRLVRRFIPRNPQLDRYLCQSCLFYRQEEGGSEYFGGVERGSLVIYLPHARAAAEVPFYHPPVEGIAFLHHPSTSPSPLDPRKTYTISIHHLPFPPTPTPPSNYPTSVPSNNPNRLSRILHHLLSTLTTHGTGLLTGYTKRVTHDVLLPRATLQDTYLRLKSTHAHRLVSNWVESTDPQKHVFEDLLIAAFLIEWWGRVYYRADLRENDTESEGVEDEVIGQKRPWVGFADIGCGNGILVDILRREGWVGWGFDARRRKTWDVLLPPRASASSPSPNTPWLREMLLIPSLLQIDKSESSKLEPIEIHNGIFPPHTFLISNHSDQLTGWTPLLGALSNCPFLAIPCCSYNLSGEKFRAPKPLLQVVDGYPCKPKQPPPPQPSAYSSLCAWTLSLAERSGWEVKKEVLRIPSTRNLGIVGVRLVGCSHEEEEEEEEEGVEERVRRVLREEGGGVGWVGRCISLVNAGGSGGKCH